MGELNPQLNTQLHVLAASPGFVTWIFAFPADYESVYRSQIMDAIERLGDSPAGRQIIEISKSDDYENHPVNCLDESLELLTKHRRLCGETKTGIDSQAYYEIVGEAK